MDVDPAAKPKLVWDSGAIGTDRADDPRGIACNSKGDVFVTGKHKQQSRLSPDDE